MRPELTDAILVTRRAKKIHYIFNTIDLGRESLQIQVKYMLYKRLLFSLRQNISSVSRFGR